MKYLCYFIHRHLDFRLPELESLAQLAGYHEPLNWSQPPGGHHRDSPFYYVDLPNDDVARAIGSRSILCRALFEVWGEGSTYEEVHAAVKQYPPELQAPYMASYLSFKVVVESFGRGVKMEEQKEKIDQFSYLQIKGPVNLKTPDVRFYILESLAVLGNEGLPPPTSPWMAFARQVAASDRTIVARYELSRRSYLGPTAMDAEVALLMANQAKVGRGTLVYDPFVGTGSILVAAAHFGATTVGADIDIRVVRDGKGPDRNVWGNFRQYGLAEPVGLLRADNNSPPWKRDLCEIFDAIVCDPPYGVRAGGRKSGGRKLLKGDCDPYTIPDHLRTNHIPSTAPYTLEECLLDLLNVAARMLRMGGRLVYFYPVSSDDYKEEDMPSHPCLETVYNTEQILTRKYSRRLLTMVKVGTYTQDMAREAEIRHAEFRTHHVRLLAESRRKGDLHGLVFSSANGGVNGDAHKVGFVDEPRKSRESTKGDEGAHRARYRAKCV